MRRGDVRWYTFKPPDKRRPIVILTRNSAIPYLNALTIAPITTTIRDIPTEVLLTPDDGVATHCVANLDNIQTVPKYKIGALIAALPPYRMGEVDKAVCFALGVHDVL